MSRTRKRVYVRNWEEKGRGGDCCAVGGTHLHTFMMWEESEYSAEGEGTRLAGEAEGLGTHCAAMQ